MNETENSSGECSICRVPLSTEQTYTLPCQHTFHTDCIVTSLRFNTECPYCRDHGGNTCNDDYASTDYDSDGYSDTEFNQFKEYFKNIKKNDPKIKQTYSELNRSIKEMDKCKSNTKSLRKVIKEKIDEEVKKYKETEEYANFKKVKKVYNSKIKAYNNAINNRLKNDDIERDGDLEWYLRRCENFRYKIRRCRYLYIPGISF